MKNIITALITAAVITCHAQQGQIMMIDSTGKVSPSNAVATVTQIAEAVAAAEAAAVQVEIQQKTEIAISNAIAQITQYINSLESVGYICGYVTEFEGAVSIDTNAYSQIVRFTPNVIVSSPQTGMAYFKLNTYFSAVPAVAPVVRYQTTLNRTNAWTQATVVDSYSEDVTINSVTYETYAQIVEIPSSYVSAFFRVFAQINGGTEATMLNVNNGISVNGRKGLSKGFTNGIDVLVIRGGICTMN